MDELNQIASRTNGDGMPQGNTTALSMRLAALTLGVKRVLEAKRLRGLYPG